MFLNAIKKIFILRFTSNRTSDTLFDEFLNTVRFFPLSIFRIIKKRIKVARRKKIRYKYFLKKNQVAVLKFVKIWRKL